MELSHVIRTLSDSIFDLSRRLDAMEKDENDRLDVQTEDQEAYMQSLEVEDPNRWIDLICEEEGEPSSSTSSPSSLIIMEKRLIVNYSW